MFDKIPLVDLKAQYLRHKEEIDNAIQTCIGNTSFIGGPDHKALAIEFAAFCGSGHAALCGNGTDALALALLELLGPGDGTGEVITVSHTFIATAEAIIAAGYRPVFVDVDATHYVMSPTAVEAAITPRTKALLPVHLYGQMAPMDALMALAEQRGLAVIEDAAQAHGASWLGKGPGQWGHAACFSFYPGKNLGAFGDGGAVFSRDEDLVKRIRMRADHGRTSKYLHEKPGQNSRLDGLQAAVLRVKLRHLARWNEARWAVAARYETLLGGDDRITLPRSAAQGSHIFHLYVIQVDERDRVLKALHRDNIGAGIHYPVPLHEQPVYASMHLAPEALPVTHVLAQHIISLPMFPEMTEAQVSRVVDALRAALDR